MIDLTTKTDEQIDQLRRDVLIEQERRANLASIPDQIEELSRTYRDGGGDPAVLDQAINGQ